MVKQKLDLNLIFGPEFITLSSLLLYVQLLGWVGEEFPNVG